MGRKTTPGLYKRGAYWHIDKQVLGYRLRESTGSRSIEEAERYLGKRIEEVREAAVYGVRPERTFKEAATKYLLDNQHKTSIEDDAMHLKLLCNYIGHLPLDKIHSGALQTFIRARQKAGRKTKTINLALGVVRHILNLAAQDWIDGNGLTWLTVAPKIKLLSVLDARKPYPMSWDEQARLEAHLPEHLHQMALFKVNTGCREQEICQLQWEWEIQVPELNTSVFIVPSYILRDGKQKQLVKNGHDRLVVLNDIARSVIDNMRGSHGRFVFTYKGKPLSRMNNSAWRRARELAGLTDVRVHDLKHTFGRRLRSAGVNFEDRQDLLGHKSGRITTHYSAAELHNLLAAANKICDQDGQKPALTLLRNDRNKGKTKAHPHNIPTADLPTPQTINTSLSALVIFSRFFTSIL